MAIEAIPIEGGTCALLSNSHACATISGWYIQAVSPNERESFPPFFPEVFVTRVPIVFYFLLLSTILPVYCAFVLVADSFPTLLFSHAFPSP
jgi:hypothetical protein